MEIFKRASRQSPATGPRKGSAGPQKKRVGPAAPKGAPAGADRRSEEEQPRQSVGSLLCASRRAEWALLLFSLALTGLYVYHICNPLHHIYSDMRGYVERAWYLAARAPFSPFDTFYPPGTSYFYAIVFALFSFGLGLQLLVILQVVMVAVAALLVGKIAALLFRSRSAGLGATAAAAVFLPFIEQAGFFASEPLFNLLMLYSLYLFVRTCEEQRPRQGCFFHIGLLSGMSLLVRTQGVTSIVAFCAAALFTRRFRAARRGLPALLAGALIPILLQIMLNVLILQRPTAQLSLNGPFNMFLGQSRRSAIGCVDLQPGSFMFYVFHNNNAGLDYFYHPPTVLPVSILDHHYFTEQIRLLWKEDPGRQVVRSLVNMVELFEVNPRWPYSNEEKTVPFDLAFQHAALWLMIVPALATAAGALAGRHFAEVLLLGLPVLGIALVAAVGTGQPRYLLPHYYHLLVLALPFYQELFTLLRPARLRAAPQTQGAE